VVGRIEKMDRPDESNNRIPEKSQSHYHSVTPKALTIYEHYFYISSMFARPSAAGSNACWRLLTSTASSGRRSIESETVQTVRTNKFNGMPCVSGAAQRFEAAVRTMCFYSYLGYF
jgi:hypothetical protein